MTADVCEICGNPPKKRALHRDHNHRTGAQRGLLCFTCNRFILGKYATAHKLLRACVYLLEYDAGGVPTFMLSALEDFEATYEIKPRA